MIRHEPRVSIVPVLELTLSEQGVNVQSGCLKLIKIVYQEIIPLSSLNQPRWVIVREDTATRIKGLTAPKDEVNTRVSCVGRTGTLGGGNNNAGIGVGYCV